MKSTSRLEALKKPVIKYDSVAPFDLLAQIKSEIMLTTVERKQMRDAVFLPWDTTTDQRVLNCKRWEIIIVPQDVIDHFVGQIYDNKVFEKEVLITWEKKKTAIKTWRYCKKYFIDHATELRNYDKTTAKDLGYHSAGNMVETQGTVIQQSDSSDMEENVNAVLDAMERSAEEMNLVAATNSKLESTISEQMKLISRLMEMNENLVKQLAAAGQQAAKKNKVAEDEKKAHEEAAKKRKAEQQEKRTRRSDNRDCEYCGLSHRGAGKACHARKLNAHLRPDNWNGTEVDK